MIVSGHVISETCCQQRSGDGPDPFISFVYFKFSCINFHVLNNIRININASKSILTHTISIKNVNILTKTSRSGISECYGDSILINRIVSALFRGQYPYQLANRKHVRRCK